MAGLSIWEKESFYAPQQVVVVGAGLMGLWCALAIKQQQPHLTVTILERHTTPLGASTRNAGFACFGSASELLHDAQLMGVDAMLAVAEARFKGIQKIRSYFNDDAIGYDACGGYECLINRAEIIEQLPFLNQLLQQVVGVPHCFVTANTLLQTMGLQGFDSLVQNPLEAGLHSGKLVKALTQLVQQNGVQILYAAHVQGYDEQGTCITLNVNGHTLQAKTVLFCTNAFTTGLVKGVFVQAARGQVILTTPIPGLALNGTFHFDEGFYYWRSLGNRILLGGARNLAFEEEATTLMEGSDKIRQHLQQFLQTHIAGQYNYSIEASWSGIMGFTADKQPLIQSLSRRTAVAVACNGMGVALTPHCAQQAAALVLQML